MSAGSLELIALPGIPEVAAGDDLADLIATAAEAADIGLDEDDVLVVTQKVVSKAEGRLVDLSTVEPRPWAAEFGAEWGKDPRQVELVLRESAEVVRIGPSGLIISRTRHGFVCANAGVDLSNVGAGEAATLLPVDPDASAAGIRDALRTRLGVAPAVVVSDSFGRPWRNGIVNVAIGSAGLAPLLDLRGRPDAAGRVMHATITAVADQLASAADLAGGKVAQLPVVVVRGWAHETGEGRSRRARHGPLDGPIPVAMSAPALARNRAVSPLRVRPSRQGASLVACDSVRHEGLPGPTPTHRGADPRLGSRPSSAGGRGRRSRPPRRGNSPPRSSAARPGA